MRRDWARKGCQGESFREREQHVRRSCGWRTCGPFSKELKERLVGWKLTGRQRLGGEEGETREETDLARARSGGAPQAQDGAPASP